MTGPLSALKVLELAGIGPAPFAAMVLADMGADVVQVARPGDRALSKSPADATYRGRTQLEVDLKRNEGRELVSSLARHADVLIEGYRPGVAERLGLGPDALLTLNPRLVYGRMTGFGQDGPLAQRAGHDINYISIAGVLGASRRAGERPMFAMNLVGDFGGGGMVLALGVVAAVLHARATGQGQVVDAAMVEGAAMLATMTCGMRGVGSWPGEPGHNLLDSGAHFYEVYETSDDRFMAVGAIEPQFYAQLLDGLELDAADWPQYEEHRWPEFKERFAEIFRLRTRDEWTELFADRDACVTPVLDLFEAPMHPHNVARDVFQDLDGVMMPRPAPRFSATRSEFGQAKAATAEAVLSRWAAD